MHQTLLQWLSRGQVLARFMELQDKIMELLQDHNRSLNEQLNGAFWIKTAYLEDTFTLDNETNRRMQGPESNVMQCKALWTLLCTNYSTVMFVLTCVCFYRADL